MQIEKLQKDIISISNKRGDNRQKALNEFCDFFLSECKQDGVITFSRDMLFDLFIKSNLKRAGRYRIVEHVLALLMANEKIREEEHVKRCYGYRNRALISYDYGSYALLMAKNGYKRIEVTDGYDGEYEEHLNHLTGRFGEHTAYYKNSRLQRNKQGCFTSGRLSIVRECKTYTKKIFIIVDSE